MPSQVSNILLCRCPRNVVRDRKKRKGEKRKTGTMQGGI